MKKQFINEAVRMQKLAGILKESSTSEFKIGDKVRFDPERMSENGFEDPTEYYEGLEGKISGVEYFDIMGDGKPTEVLYIDLNKPIQPPGGFDGDSDGMDEVTLVKSQGHYDMIYKINS